jgi:hypothetical protein
MYNAEIKQRFLDESNVISSTKKNYKYILEKADRTEKALGENGKDIYEMTPYECDQLIYSYPRKSEGVIFVLVSCLKRYFEFCKSINLVSAEDFNYFETLKGASDIQKYLDMTAIDKKYITVDELDEIQGLCANQQDAVIPELLFIGLGGDRASELLNLKVSDVKSSHIDKNGVKIPAKIILENREISISERTYEIISDAVEQSVYLRGNGEADIQVMEFEMNDSEYVLKPAGKTKVGQLGYPALLQRVNRIKKYFGNPYISPTGLKVSGQIYMAQQIKSEKGEVNKEDYIEIGKRFGSNLAWNIIKSKIERYI